MKAEPFSDEVVCCSFCVNLLGARNKMNDLSMPINNELKRVVAIYVWQSSDEVTRYDLSGTIRDLIRLKRTMWFGM